MKDLMRRFLTKISNCQLEEGTGYAYIVIKSSLGKPGPVILPFALFPQGLNELALPEFLMWRNLGERREKSPWQGMWRHTCPGRSGRSGFIQASGYYCMPEKWTEDESDFQGHSMEIDTLL